MGTAEAESNEKEAGRTAGVESAAICGRRRVAVTRLDERAGGSQSREKDERRRNNNPVQGDTAERQDRRYSDERNTSDGDGLAATTLLCMVPDNEFPRWPLSLGVVPGKSAAQGRFHHGLPGLWPQSTPWLAYQSRMRASIVEFTRTSSWSAVGYTMSWCSRP